MSTRHVRGQRQTLVTCDPFSLRRHPCTKRQRVRHGSVFGCVRRNTNGGHRPSTRLISSPSGAGSGTLAARDGTIAPVTKGRTVTEEPRGGFGDLVGAAARPSGFWQGSGRSQRVRVPAMPAPSGARVRPQSRLSGSRRSRITPCHGGSRSRGRAPGPGRRGPRRGPWGSAFAVQVFHERCGIPVAGRGTGRDADHRRRLIHAAITGVTRLDVVGWGRITASAQGAG